MSASWTSLALDAVHRVAQRLPLFTTEDVWRELGRRDPAECRVIGPIMQRAAALGYCSATSQVLKTKDPCSHRRPLTIWTSRILP